MYFLLDDQAARSVDPAVSVRGGRIRLLRLVKLQQGELFQLPDGEDTANDSGSSICNRSGIHDTVDSHEDREDKDQWQQEQDLSGQ